MSIGSFLLTMRDRSPPAVRPLSLMLRLPKRRRLSRLPAFPLCSPLSKSNELYSSSLLPSHNFLSKPHNPPPPPSPDAPAPPPPSSLLCCHSRPEEQQVLLPPVLILGPDEPATHDEHSDILRQTDGVRDGVTDGVTDRQTDRRTDSLIPLRSDHRN